jgi:sec-independent protein translocase protein TatA
MNTVLAFGMPGGWEWIVIVLFVVIFFGAKKIPEIARGLGKGIREFKDATKEIKKEIEEPSQPQTKEKASES